MKALILEDNQQIAQFLQIFLSEKGWHVSVKHSFAAALRFLDHTAVDLLILDILLPDKKGHDLLRTLSTKKPRPFTKVALISGIIDKTSALKQIPSHIKEDCVFFKKPIDEQRLSIFLKQINTTTTKKQKDIFDSFFEKDLSSYPLNFYLSTKRTFESKYLIPILFSAHIKKFTGHINIQTKHSVLIKFCEGNIIQLTSTSEKSFFGNLLVEHNLCLQEDIQILLNEKEDDKLLGKRLVEKELLSPFMLNVILKEQIKVRLFEVMNYPSFQLTVIEKPIRYGIDDIDFNDIDFIEWLANSLQTELDTHFLEKFFLKIKSCTLYKNVKIHKSLIYQKKFLHNYNLLFQSIQKENTVQHIIELTKNKYYSMRLLYFGLLTKSIFLKTTQNTNTQDLHKLESFVNSILEKDPDDPFSTLQLPWKASTLEAKDSYRALAQKIHPQTLPLHTSKQLKKKCEKALCKITQSYEILKSETKRAEYLKVQKQEDLMLILDQYEEGLTKIKQEQYSKSIEILSPIMHNKHAPTNTILYILWAKLKSNTSQDLTNDRAKATKIKKEIDSCSLSLQISPLFWYVKGLFYVQIKQYEKAKELFTKSLKIERDFTEAKKELLLLKQKVQDQQIHKNRFFNFFLKKSG